MLGKLIKNDIRSGSHSVFPVYLAAIIAAGMMAVSILTKNTEMQILSSLILLLIMLVVVCVTFIMVLSMFRKSMYGDVGYLTMTLPVKEWQLIFSKTLTGILFILVSYFGLIGSVVGVAVYAYGQAGVEMALQIWEYLEMYGVPGTGTVALMCGMFAILGLVQIFYIVSTLHLSATFSNTPWFSRFGNIGGVIIFFVIYPALNALATAIGNLIHFYVTLKDSSVVFTFSKIVAANARASGGIVYELSRVVILLAFAVGLCAITTLIVKKSVNVR